MEEKGEVITEPKKVDFLDQENLKALKVSCGYDHTLLMCEDKDTKQKKFFSIGYDENNV